MRSVVTSAARSSRGSGQALGAQRTVVLLEPLGDDPAAAHPEGGGHLVGPGDVVAEVDTHDRAGRNGEALEAHRFPPPVLGDERGVDRGGAGERVEQDHDLPGVPGGGSPREVPGRGGEGRARGRVLAVVAGHPVLDGDVPTVDLHECGGQRRLHHISEPHHDPFAGRDGDPLDAGGGRSGLLGRPRRRGGRGEPARVHGQRGLDVAARRVLDGDGVVGETALLSSTRGAVPGGRLRRGTGRRRHDRGVGAGGRPHDRGRAGPAGPVVAGVEGDRPGDRRCQHQHDGQSGGEAPGIVAVARRPAPVAATVGGRRVRVPVAVAPLGHWCTPRAHE
jgi:hypothetical protein